MKLLLSLASATTLLAVTAFTQDAAMQPSAPALHPVAARGTQKTAQATAAADVVTAANAFLATLSTSQQSTVLQAFNSANVQKWSNFPVGIYKNRIGIRLDALTTAQKTAALAVVQAATGTTANEGYDEIQQLRAADDNLNQNGGGSDYGNGVYFIAFLGQPSNTGTWLLQFGGHHLATNITYSNGYVTGPSPKFEGVEPLTFTTINSDVLPSGTTYSPQAQEQAGMLNMISGLTTAQKATAKLSTTYSDVVVGPQKDGSFPTTKSGLACSQLTSAQQDLVMAAMAPWVNDVDDATAAQLLSYYKTQLASTYIAYSGTGNFTSANDYARIDGPNVWVEFSVQNGIVYRNQVHYHTIYRDRARDYGGNFYSTVTATKSAAASAVFGLYPNPIAGGGSLQVALLAPASSARYTVRDLLGRSLSSGSFSGSSASVGTSDLATGTYLLTVETDAQTPVTSRFQVR